MLAQLTSVVAASNGAKDTDFYDFAPSFERPRVEFLDAIANMR